MNLNDEQNVTARFIDKSTGEEVCVFDSISMQKEFTHSVDFSTQKDLSLFSISLGAIEIEPEYVGKLMPGMRVDVEGWGTRLPRGKKMPKRKRLRKKWSKKYGEEFQIKNVLLQV